MTLLNYKNTHFNLILEENHPLVTPSQVYRQDSVTEKGGLEGRGQEERMERQVISNKEKLLCSNCDKVFECNKEIRSHIRLEHKDKYISIL